MKSEKSVDLQEQAKTEMTKMVDEVIKAVQKKYESEFDELYKLVTEMNESTNKTIKTIDIVFLKDIYQTLKNEEYKKARKLLTAYIYYKEKSYKLEFGENIEL